MPSKFDDASWNLIFSSTAMVRPPMMLMFRCKHCEALSGCRILQKICCENKLDCSINENIFIEVATHPQQETHWFMTYILGFWNIFGKWSFCWNKNERFQKPRRRNRRQILKSIARLYSFPLVYALHPWAQIWKWKIGKFSCFCGRCWSFWVKIWALDATEAL